jgi:hypothetical protein
MSVVMLVWVVGVLLLVLLAAVVVAGALLAADGAEGFFEEAGGLLAGAAGVADGIQGDGALGADPDVDAFFRAHVRLGSGGEGEFDGAVGLLPPGDAEVLLGGLAHRLVDAVELEETAVVGTDLALDVTVPPVGGQLVGLGGLGSARLAAMS